MKGFGGILLLLTVFVVAIFLLSVNHTTTQENSQKEEVFQTKVVLANYEIALKQAVLDCNWNKLIDINTCIDSNAQTLLDRENAIQKLLTCTKTNVDRFSPDYHFDLNCTSTFGSEKNKTDLTLSKRITIKKF